METLFDDKEVFIKTRPTKIPDNMLEEFYTGLANEVKQNDWCEKDDDIDDIVSDFKNHVSSLDSGYEIAKDLENYGRASYNINSEFIEFLEDFDYRKRNVLEDIVKQWVKIHDPQPLFQKGDKLMIKIDLNHKMPFGMEMYITGFSSDIACYLVHSDINHNGGYIIPYEKIESNCIKL